MTIKAIAVNPEKPEQFFEFQPEKRTSGEYELLV